MCFSADGRLAAFRHVLLAIVGMASLGALGCTTSPASKDAAAKSTHGETPAVTQNNPGPGIDLNCVINHIQNPTESFHYTFRDESPNRWEEEADVTPQRIDGSFANNSLPQPQQFHGTPQEVWSNLGAIRRMASLFAIVRKTSAVVNSGTENVNGYETTKYSIDTSRGNATEQGLYSDVLGKGGFAKGTVWTASQGCLVKLTLDEELHSKDGSVQDKAHYEEAMVRK